MKSPKKSSITTCFGPRINVSISEPANRRVPVRLSSRKRLQYHLSPTRSVNPQPITSKRKDLPSSRIHCRRRQALLATDDLDEFDSDALKQLQHLCPIPSSKHVSIPRVSACLDSHRRLLSYLRSVSAGLSKLFWLFNSDTNSSFAATSSGVGNIVEIGGVTPHWRVDGVAILGCVVSCRVVRCTFTTGTYRNLRQSTKDGKKPYRINSDSL